MKNKPDTFSIDFSCLQTQTSPFGTVILYNTVTTYKTFFHINRLTCTVETLFFLIEAASMLASSQIKVVKPPDKKPYISDMGRLSLSLNFNFNFFGRNCVTTFSWLGCFKSMIAYVYWWQAQSSFPCRSATYMLKMSGPMIEPCGTPKLKLIGFEIWSSIWTKCSLPQR